MNTPHILNCHRLTKHFDSGDQRITVLDKINLQVAQGESVAIVGVSGSGKSTLLHLLGGLDKPSDGEVILKDKDLSRINEAELCRCRNQEIGFIYQFHHLLGDFNVLENVLMPLRITRNKTQDDIKRATDILNEVGLQHRISHKPHQLSGGERQRVALCRALINEPAVILADEPTGQLDQENAQKVIDQMLELKENKGIALIVATHDMAFAKRLDTTYQLNQGVLIPGDS